MFKSRARIGLCVLVATVLAACATTNLGQTVQVAEAQKKIVETAAKEVIKLHLTGKIPDTDYQKARAAYEKWAAGQRALAESTAKWRSVSLKVAEAKARAEAVKSAENEQDRAAAQKELEAAEAQLALDLANVRPLVDAYLGIVLIWLDKPAQR